MTSELVVLLANREVGRVHQGTAGQLTFTYDEAWRSRADAYPLSLSLPLAVAEHARDAIRPYLWGLLPDNDQVLATWGRRFSVSAPDIAARLRALAADPAAGRQSHDHGQFSLAGAKPKTALLYENGAWCITMFGTT